MTNPRTDLPRHGAFQTSESLRAGLSTFSPGALDLEDVAEMLLLLRGESVVDWHRLWVTNADQCRRLFALNAIDIDDPLDRERLEDLRRRAAQYITDTLALRLDPVIARDVPALELPLIASGKDRSHRDACTLLKVMHIMHHLDARELSTVLSVPINELFSLVEESVVEMFDAIRAAGVPVAEFSWSRKTRESQVTKLLVKKDTSAARLFDRLRFRLIVESPDDIVPALHVMLHRCIPFNYVLPGQTVNSLLSSSSVVRRGPDKARQTRFRSGEYEEVTDAPINEFSGSDYRVLNFVADLPVRIDGILWDEDPDLRREKGRVVFVLAEFQVLDRSTADLNERGDTSHDEYKKRQHQRVRERLLREPKPRGGNGSR